MIFRHLKVEICQTFWMYAYKATFWHQMLKTVIQMDTDVKCKKTKKQNKTKQNFFFRIILQIKQKTTQETSFLKVSSWI